MLLSILTINYNNKEGLRRTLQSVAEQNGGDYEHIIIDGGSTDGSADLIKEFLERPEYARRVTFWCSEPDGGIYQGMNKGIEHLNGDYCLMLNSGDYLYDNDALKNISESSLAADIITFNFIEVSGKKRRLVRQPEKMTAGFWFKNDGLNHQSTLIRTSFQKENPYGNRYKVRNDSDFFMKAFFKLGASYAHIDKTLSCYMLDGFSSTASKELMKQERDDLLLSYADKFYYDDLADYAKISLALDKDFDGFGRRIVNMYCGLREKLKELKNKK